MLVRSELWKRCLVLLLAGIFCIAMLAGCSNGETSDAADSGAEVESSAESKGTQVGLEEGILLQKPMYTARGPEDIPWIKAWLETLPDDLDLCVGGPRASECPEAYQITAEILSAILC